MRTRVGAIAVIAILVVGTGFADFERAPNLKVSSAPNAPEANGTLGALSLTVQQVGALQGRVDLAITTTGGSNFSPSSAVLLYGQLYDYPWQGGLPPGGSNTFVTASLTRVFSATAGGSFNASFVFTVPAPNTYQAFGLALAGYTVTPPPYTFLFSQATSVYPGPTAYIDAQQPPTPTLPAAGAPVPTMSHWGIAAMLILLAGVAVLLLSRRS